MDVQSVERAHRERQSRVAPSSCSCASDNPSRRASSPRGKMYEFTARRSTLRSHGQSTIKRRCAIASSDWGECRGRPGWSRLQINGLALALPVGGYPRTRVGGGGAPCRAVCVGPAPKLAPQLCPNPALTRIVAQLVMVFDVLVPKRDPRTPAAQPASQPNARMELQRPAGT
jgi:hypothetical protein